MTLQATRRMSSILPTGRLPRLRLPSTLIAGAVIIGAFVIVAVLAPVIARYNPVEIVGPPIQGPSSAHWLGTDSLGRDVLSRLMYAARLDLPLSVAVVVISAMIGTAIGSIAAYRGGWLDNVLTGVGNVAQAFPIYVLLLAIITAFGPGVTTIIVSYAAINWVTYARLIRGEIFRIKGLDFVQAAVTSGISGPRILIRHLLPNAAKQTYVYMTSDVVLAVTTIAAFSYFGIGVQPPTPEWGGMVAESQQYLTTEPWLAVVPGVAIVLLGIGFALLGDGLDDYLEAR